ncbi:MAG TPA: histidine triad nucleotide-binding protein [Thermodesulfobacteriota bacterium]|nr:histidine triad nucleotide-binding protein [Deltaproteobacteria bacterium]HNR12950.1 histidine triad nucleotide-binding protein [Thermodesulfobacteriota bacterium]HNU72005.1 histidine triad nucleotide-binding protein [Thermodesulfobacteriota bacterium]HOC37665.1 histidine triad nucleotide-binding protein [Thermodesulfobacteriota bacterium]HQO77076.1 histidine triad nucleotide-binding protein [Thermodesulfobacteriota bacterium]
MTTLFSRIIAREVPAEIVYQDSQVTAFRDARPAAPVHILIVPNKEIATVNDFEEEDTMIAGHLILVAKNIARQEGISESGYRLIINCNDDAGQEIRHVHLHLIGGRPLGPMVGW